MENIFFGFFFAKECYLHIIFCGVGAVLQNDEYSFEIE
jgi:hypothetical protein